MTFDKLMYQNAWNTFNKDGGEMLANKEAKIKRLEEALAAVERETIDCCAKIVDGIVCELQAGATQLIEENNKQAADLIENYVNNLKRIAKAIRTLAALDAAEPDELRKDQWVGIG